MQRTQHGFLLIELMIVVAIWAAAGSVDTDLSF